MPAPFASGSGVVASFDDQRGDGSITADDGSPWWFHCTQIAGGERSILAGTLVHFVVRPGRLGRWEAADVRQAGPIPAAPTEIAR